MDVGDYAQVPPSVLRSNDIAPDGSLGSWARPRPVSRSGSRMNPRAVLALKRVPSLRMVSRKYSLNEYLRASGVDGVGFNDGASAGQGEGLGFWQALLAPIANAFASRQQTKAANIGKDTAAIQAQAAREQFASQERVLAMQAENRTRLVADISKLAIPVLGIGAVALILARKKR